MPDVLKPEFAFQRLAQRIDDPYARAVVVIIVDKNGEVDTAARGVRNDSELFQILHAVTSAVADDVIPQLEPERSKQGPVIYVPRLPAS